MVSDRRRLRAGIRALESARSSDRAWRQVEAMLDRSVERRSRRAASTPAVRFPGDLPVTSHVGSISTLLREHQAVIVCGETGSGKTTQLPKILLSMGLGAAGMIGHTQPRRLAARSVAARIADELGVSLGSQVGSKVRFSDRTSPDTLIKVMTDGVLLAEMQSDRDLSAYEALIIDEAHERSLNIDFILGYVKQLMAKRRDLKVVVTSATIDPKRFSEHLGTEGQPAPIVEVSGRTYPVEVRYRSPRAQGEDEADLQHLQALRGAVDELCVLGSGDILVFEPGEREIREAAEMLSRHAPPGTEILPLYGRLAHHEQDRVFSRHSGRRIVVATNVAETSLTVPGIRYVIDAGTARVSRYTPRTKLQRLEIEPISQASARQRAGRCGRTSDGVCIRLYEESDLLARPEFTAPEIHRSNLASVILRMKALHLGPIERFPFIDPPDGGRVRDGIDVLTELGALDDRRELTDVGRALSRLPVDPRLGRMLLEADRLGALAEVLIIVSALSVQDPRERPFDRRDEADAAHEQFEHPESDFLALLNLWRFYDKLTETLGASRLRNACRQNFLSYLRMREWRDTHRQLRLLLGAMGYHASDRPASEEVIHRALLVGMLDAIGHKNRDGIYEGTQGQKFAIFPGSGLAEKPSWIVAAEIVHTSRSFARTCARIDPAWVEHAVGERLRRTYSEPSWDARSGRILASERATYRGLELHRGRRVHYGPIDPDKSREMFIQFALVEAELRPRPAFLEHNVALVSELERFEAKARSLGAYVSDEAVFRFYDARLPDDVCSAQRLRSWLRRAERDDPATLRMRREDILPADAVAPDPSLFPDSSEVLGVPLDVSYVHDPTRDDDGAAVDVLVHELGRLDADAEAWLVPAWVQERVEAILRALPKVHRRRLDVRALAAGAASSLRPGAGRLVEQLQAFVHRQTGIEIPVDQFDESRVPGYMRTLVRVFDVDGTQLATGRDIDTLRQSLSGVALDRSRSVGSGGYPKRGFVAWTFDDPPERIQADIAGRDVDMFPAIVDEGTSVAIELRTDHAAAMAESRAGIRRLLALALRGHGALDLRRDSRLAYLTMLYAPIGTKVTLRDQLVLAIVDRAADLEGQVPLNRQQFEERARRAEEGLDKSVDDVLDLAGAVLKERQGASLALEARTPTGWHASVDDMLTQLNALVPSDFLTRTPARWLVHLPRYLKGIRRRYEKISNAGLERDVQRMRELDPVLSAFVDRYRMLGALAPSSRALTDARWHIEELRISMFAQELRTSLPVSVDRVIRSIQAIDR